MSSISKAIVIVETFGLSICKKINAVVNEDNDRNLPATGLYKMNGTKY